MEAVPCRCPGAHQINDQYSLASLLSTNSTGNGKIILVNKTFTMAGECGMRATGSLLMTRRIEWHLKKHN